MSSVQGLRDFITQRLTAAAVEIFSVFEQTVVRYEEELDRQRRLLEIPWKPGGKSTTAGIPRQHEEEQQRCDQETSSGLPIKEEPEVKEEPEDVCGAPSVVKLEPDTVMVTVTGGESDHGEAEADGLQLPSRSSVRRFINRQLTAAAVEIFSVVEQTVERRREVGRKPTTTGSPSPQFLREKLPCDVETSGEPDPEEIQSVQIKEEDVCTSEEGDTFVLKEEPDAFLVTPPDEIRESDQVGEPLVSFGCAAAASGGYVDSASGQPAALANDEIPFVVVSTSPASDTHTDSEQKSFKCETCGKAFGRIQQLRKHRRIHTGEKPHCCPTCGKRFIQKQNLKTHMKTHTGEKPFSCEACGKSFSQKGHLKSHMNIHTGEKPYFCETCGKHFRHKISFLIHMRNHTGEKPFLCNTCGTAFTNSAALKKHTIIHTGEKLFSCEMCSKTFRIQRNLMVHMKTHSDVKSFFCETCGKGFSRQGNLLAHMRTHTGEKPHHCEICGKTFSRHSNLSVHMRTHTGAKPHTCDTCGKSFSQQSSLAAHKRIHTGEKPYSCEICGRGFTEHGNMLVHRRTHTGEKPYSCAVCRKRFSQQTSLSAHMKTHTGEKLQS